MKICEFRPTQWIETENPIDYIIENIYCNRTMWRMKLDTLRQKKDELYSTSSRLICRKRNAVFGTSCVLPETPECASGASGAGEAQGQGPMLGENSWHCKRVSSCTAVVLDAGTTLENTLLVVVSDLSIPTRSSMRQYRNL